MGINGVCMTFLAIIAALVIIGIGFALGVVVPRWVRWDLRSATMIAIWVVFFVLAIAAGIAIA